MSIDGFFEKIRASFEKLLAFQKSHDAAFGRVIYILGRVKRYLGFGILLYVALFELDGYRYLINSDPDVPAQEAVGILFRYFILPIGALFGTLTAFWCLPLRPIKRFLLQLVKWDAVGVVEIAAVTGFFGYSAECPVIVPIFTAAAIVLVCTILAEKALLFIKDAGKPETEGQKDV